MNFLRHAEQKSQIRIRASDVYAMLEGLKYQFGLAGVDNIEFVDDMRIGEGEILGSDSVDKYRVGVQELLESPDKLLPAHEAMLPFLSFFHDM